MAELEIIGDSKAHRNPSLQLDTQKQMPTPSASGDMLAKQQSSDEQQPISDLELDQKSTDRDMAAADEDEIVAGPALRFAGQQARWHYDSEEYLGQVALEARVAFEEVTGAVHQDGALAGDLL